MVCDHTCQKKKKNAEDTKYLKATFPKLMKNVLVGPQKKSPHKDKNYFKTLVLNIKIRNDLSGTVKIFCITRDVKMFRNGVNFLLLSFTAKGCRMSLKVLFFDLHLVVFTDNNEAMTDEARGIV